jgi:RNA polymerase sigma-70 factor (ECF subfamily)
MTESGEISASMSTPAEDVYPASASEPFDLQAFFARHYPGLRSLLLRRIGDAALAHDILSDAIETTVRKLNAGQIRRPDEAAGYVYQVAMNLLRNHRRNAGNRPDRRADPAQLDSLPAQARQAEETLDRRIADRVRAIIEQLPTPRDREIVKRFYFDEDDKDAICRDLDLSPLHFDKVIFRARQRLRSLLEATGLKKSDFFGWLWMCWA